MKVIGAACVTAVFGVANCFANDQLLCEKHPWYREIPIDRLAILDRHEISREEFEVVTTNQGIVAAKSLLRHQAVVSISRASAAKLTGRIENSWPLGQLFLVRGVRLPTAGGRFQVSAFEKQVLVRFAFLGVPEGTAISAPIIAMFRKRPVGVYTLCTGSS